MKRQCISELPPHLVLHLKRFEFDFDTLRKKKLNDHFEIPRFLNLKGLTKEGVAARDAADGRQVLGDGSVLVFSVLCDFRHMNTQAHTHCLCCRVLMMLCAVGGSIALDLYCIGCSGIEGGRWLGRRRGEI